MGKLVVTEFVSIDGVFEDPGGAEEYEHGGWTFEYDRGEDGDVVSNTLTDPEWQNMAVISGGATEEVSKLRDRPRARSSSPAAAPCAGRAGDRMIDQPTAQNALKQLEPLLGEWVLEASSPDGEPWPGEARASFEWHESRAHLVARTSADIPGAPNTISIIGCDAANGTYFQLYSDDRGVCRVYEMSIGAGEWKLWREGDPFPQRFTATISEDGNTIAGRWEKAEDGTSYTTDFYLTYTRVK